MPQHAGAACGVLRSTALPKASFLDDLFGGSPNATKREEPQRVEKEKEESMSVAAFQAEREKRTVEQEEFDGYALRDAILEKWGHCFDMDFQRVDAYGMRKLYLNVLPFRLGARRFRHETELDYLCHLQAIVEILEKYNQLDYVLYQIDETNKKPRAGTSPLVAVPLRLDLAPEQINSILGYRSD